MKNDPRRIVPLGVLAALALAASQSQAETLAVLRAGNLIYRVDTLNAALASPAVALVGFVDSGEQLDSIDVRPATGELYGVSNRERIYRIDVATGRVAPVIEGRFAATNFSPYNIDFNPVVDRIRLLGAGGKNLRLHPDTGVQVAADGDIAYQESGGVTPRIAAIAYDNNRADATVTTLVGIDTATRQLVTIGSRGSAPISPNSGTVILAGRAGINPVGGPGFSALDISGATNAAYFTNNPFGDTADLYVMDTAKGGVRHIGTLPGDMRSLAVLPAVPREVIAAITQDGRLITFYSDFPTSLLSDDSITGLAGGVVLGDLDLRPATGELFSIGSDDRLYRVSPTGVATAVGGPIIPSPTEGLAGFDFNPSVDRIRVSAANGINLRLNPNDGLLVAQDTSLAYANGDPNAGDSPTVVGAAYSGNVPASPMTTLYVIDNVQGVLARQGSMGSVPVSPNAGQLFTVGSLGVELDGNLGFDISGSSGIAYLAAGTLGLAGGTSAFFHRVNLQTGTPIPVGLIGEGESIAGMTAMTTPSGNPVVVIAALGPTQWTPTTVSPFAPPFFDAEDGLIIGSFANPENTFGFWQTSRELAALPIGRYRIRMELATLPATEGARRPELRVRLFNADNTLSRFALLANPIPGDTAPTFLNVLWESDGTTPWRIALDLLSFQPDIQGGYRITAISVSALE